jgi:hypothetical protein
LAFQAAKKSRYKKPSMPIHDVKNIGLENSYFLVSEILTALLLG